MSDPLSPVIANVFVSKLVHDVVTLKSPYSTTGMLMIFSLRNPLKNEPDELLESMNSYHRNIKFTVEENPSHFLDTFTENVSIKKNLVNCQCIGRHKHTEIGRKSQF